MKAFISVRRRLSDQKNSECRRYRGRSVRSELTGATLKCRISAVRKCSTVSSACTCTVSEYYMVVLSVVKSSDVALTKIHVALKATGLSAVVSC